MGYINLYIIVTMDEKYQVQEKKNSKLLVIPSYVTNSGNTPLEIDFDRASVPNELTGRERYERDIGPDGPDGQPMELWWTLSKDVPDQRAKLQLLKDDLKVYRDGTI